MTLKHRIGKVVLPLLPVNRRTFDILRFELNAVGTQIWNKLSPRARRVRRDLLARQGLSVNVGSGGRGLTDWINIDISRGHKDQTIGWDIRRGLPLANGSVRRLLAEHVVEHLDFREDVPRLMRELYRVLEPGGLVRIIVPDAERWLNAYVSRDLAQWEALGFHPLPSNMPTPMAAVNHVFHQEGEHLFAYDFDTLRYALEQGGFIHIERRAYREGADPSLCLDQPNHAPYSLYVEAQK